MALFRHRAEVGIISAAAVLIVLGAKPYAGSWNDASRLAAIESLAERGTFRIDESPFLGQSMVAGNSSSAYQPSASELTVLGTYDKLWINGHYYSDKSPVPSVIFAGAYRLWLELGGPRMHDRPDLVVRFLTLLGAGLPCLFAIAMVICLARKYLESAQVRFWYLASFVMATVVLPYTQHLNNGMLLLGVAMPLCGLLDELSEFTKNRWERWGRPALIGMLTGFGYTIDLGIGPALVVATLGFTSWRLGIGSRWLILVVAMIPPILLHHALNYAVGGTLMPANAVLEYLQFPGSPFNDRTATGGMKHSVSGLIIYGLDLLVGKKGFLTHNWPLFLATLGAIRIFWEQPRYRAILGFCLGWAGLSWWTYAATSTNLSGVCLSIRWFVPLLAPGYWALAIFLKEQPRYSRDLIWLSCVGCGMTVVMMVYGPWMPHLVPGWWVWVAVAGIGWGVIRIQEFKCPRKQAVRGLDRPVMRRSFSFV